MGTVPTNTIKRSMQVQQEKPLNPVVAVIILAFVLGGIGFWIYKVTEPNRENGSKAVAEQAKAYDEFVKSGGKVDSHGKIIKK